ncbi:thermonuclease family protein [bacterium]|nr:thermonuclease family protein [bacterium]
MKKQIKFFIYCKNFYKLIYRDVFLVRLIFTTVSIILIMAVIHSKLNHKECFRKNLPEVKTSSLFLKEGPFRIKSVIDGDTIRLSNDQLVRFIGIDAPEVHHPVIPVQRFGQESARFLKQIAEGHKCFLEYEPHNKRDKYGRVLAYVFINDRLINAEMIRWGYAYAYTRFPFHRRDKFIILEQEARRKQYGLWHLTLRDGRIANLAKRYESLSLRGRKELDKLLNDLVEKYPLEKVKNQNDDKTKY